MAKIQVKITPSLAVMLRPGTTDWIILEQEIAEGSNADELLSDLARNDATFHKVLFDSKTGKASDEIDLVLNNTFLPPSERVEARLHDGDSIILLPAYIGG